MKQDFTLLGYSMGGSIASVFAHAHPDKVRQLVLIASAGLVLQESKTRRIVQQVPLFGTWLMYSLFPRLHRKGAEAERNLPTSVPDVVDLQINELRFRGFVPAVLASIRGILTEDLSEDHRSIHRAGVPVLAVWGRLDDVIPLTAMGRMVEVSRSSRQEVIRNAGHGLTYTHSQAVLDAMRDTLRDGLI
ncbi:MAG: alpha/beta fold hydrolase [Paracoccaceae bacterium]